MDSIEKAIKKAIKKAYPDWSSLSYGQKEIVNGIAMQLPISCEDVAKIFIYCDSDRQKTIDYLRQQYGFVVE